MKRDRHTEIIRLIHECEIGTQEELAKKLNENGFAVTQATVSRDIRALQLTKVTDASGHVRYTLMRDVNQTQSGKFVRVLRDAFVSTDTADNILVIKTVSGMAMAAAAALDGLAWPEIVGSSAGDDTIFCAARSKSAAVGAMEKLKGLVESV